MPNATDVQRALDDGALRSRQASTLTAAEQGLFEVAPGGTVTRYRDGQLQAAREPLTPQVLWRRFKWPIIALGFFLLIELLSMAKLVTVMGTHF